MSKRNLSTERESIVRQKVREHSEKDRKRIMERNHMRKMNLEILKSERAHLFVQLVPLVVQLLAGVVYLQQVKSNGPVDSECSRASICGLSTW